MILGVEVVILCCLAFLAYIVLQFLGLCEGKKYNSLLLETLQCIQDHDIPKYFDRLKEIIRRNPAIINYAHGTQGNTPFLRACELAATNIVNEMINLGADLKYANLEGNGPLYFATYYLVKHPGSRNASCLRKLYYAGCDINQTNKNGYTPLHLAAYHGHIPLIRWLLEKGANPDMEPLPAGLALANGCNSAACLLIKKPVRIQKSKSMPT